MVKQKATNLVIFLYKNALYIINIVCKKQTKKGKKMIILGLSPNRSGRS